MKLKAINEYRDSEEGVVPSKITVEMSLEEAIWIGKIARQQRGVSPHEGVFNCLIGDVFNRYWEDGIDGAYYQYPVQLPPIKYES